MKNSGDFGEEWTRLGYPEDMGSSSFLRPPPKEFIRAYHMTSCKYGLDDLTRHRLKVARFSEVNDPFELLGLNCHDPRVRKLTARFREEQNRRRGLLSFTRNWRSPVLWSHYADRHRGICLGFDLRRTIVEEVIYADERLRAQLTDTDPGAVPERIQRQLSQTKARAWEYEQELRVLVTLETAVRDSEYYFWPFNSEMRLAEVILGPRCNSTARTVAAHLGDLNPPAVVCRARLAFRSFRIVVDGRTKPSGTNR